jgi:hypothetical protein
MYVPDNYDAFDVHEATVYRKEVREKKMEHDEDIAAKDLPFYYDPQTYIELGGKKPWKKEQL